MKGSAVFVQSLLLIGALIASADLRAEPRPGPAAPLIVVRVQKPMQQAIADLKDAIANHNYVFIRQQYVDSRLTEVGIENGEVILVYFCNFRMANRALKTDPRVGVFLPCKITLIQKPGYVQMVAINPQAISGQLQEHNLKAICDQLTHDYSRILEEASL